MSVITARPLTAVPLTARPLTAYALGASTSGAAAFSPVDLFAAGEQGVYYDPSDFSTMWQDSARTTPVTTFGQPVGAINDKSGNGNHATQATSSKRPVTGRVPFGGRRNLLLATDTLSTQSYTTKAVAHRLSFTGTGTITLSGASTAGPLVGTGVGDRVSLSFTPTAASLTLTVSGSVTFAQLELGSTTTAYQKVTTAFDVTESGKADCWYLGFDGVDDALTATVNLTSTDKLSHWYGALTEAASQQRTLVGFNGRPASGPNYSFEIEFPTYSANIADPKTRFRPHARGTQNSAYGMNFDAPEWNTNNVYMLRQNLAGGSFSENNKTRLNGVLQGGIAGGNTTTGTAGNFSSGTLAIGSYVPVYGTYLLGKVFSVIIQGRTATTQEIADGESWVANKTGVTL